MKKHWLGLITILCWLPIPWLYLDPPDLLAGQPLSIHAVLLYLGGVAASALLLHQWLQLRIPGAGGRTLVFLYTLILVTGYQLSGLAPAWDCLGKQLYTSTVKAQSGCTTVCTNNDVKPCSGWSSCWNKFVSCSGSGRDQDGRPCQGCCFSCAVVCPTSEPPSPPTGTPTPAATQTPTRTPTLMPTSTPAATVTPSPTSTPMPPSITGLVACELDGDAGWCKGKAALELMAYDPQGLDVTIKGDLNGVRFSCGSSCSLPLPEGVGSAYFTALSSSGRSADGAVEWRRDVTPPVLALALPVPDGRLGWYVSKVELSAAAQDALSGLSSLAGSTDGGTTWGPFPIQLADGVHKVSIRARDVAGNEVTETEVVRVDTLPPVLQIRSHSDGTQVEGDILLEGDFQEDVSGIAGGEISFDGGMTWQAVELDADGAWSFHWMTGGIANGRYSLLVRGIDLAGNVGEGGSTTLDVANRPPGVSITDRWWIWESGRLKVSPNTFQVAYVTVTIRDPQNRWPARVMEFDPGKVPGAFSWDRRFADGTLAPSGEYRVEIVACDVHGLCGRGVGMIAIPHATTSTIASTPMPVWTPTHTPQVTVIPTRITATPVAVTVTAPQEVPSGPVENEQPIHLWPLLSLLCLFFGIALAGVLDPRPAALGRLGGTIQLISGHQGNDPIELDEGKTSKGI